MKIKVRIPGRTYYIAYHGVVIHIENNMRSALSRIPRDACGWRITYVLEGEEGASPRVALVGT